MPLIKSGSKTAISTNIREMMAAGHPQKQAIAAALSNARRYGRRYADGGEVDDLSLSDLPLPKPGQQVAPSLTPQTLSNQTLGASKGFINSMTPEFLKDYSGDELARRQQALQQIGDRPGKIPELDKENQRAAWPALGAVEGLGWAPLGGGAKLAMAGLGAAKPFYSAAQEAIAGSRQAVASGEQWLNMLRNTPGIRNEELDWTGLNKALNTKGPIGRDEVLSHLQANEPQIQEVNRGANIGGPFRDPESPSYNPDKLERESATKYSDYQLPGGENYREMLLTLPSKRPSFEEWVKSPEALSQIKYDKEFNPDIANTPDRMRRIYDSGVKRNKFSEDYYHNHWPDPNVLAHIRMNDRTVEGPNGPLKTLFLEEVQSDWHQAGRKLGYQGYLREPKGEIIHSPSDREFPWQIMVDGVERNRVRSMDAAEDVLQDEINIVKKQKGGVPDAPFKQSWPELALKRAMRYASDNGYDAVAWTPGHVQSARYPDPENAAGLHKFYDQILPSAANKIAKKHGTSVTTGTFERPGLRANGEMEYKGPHLNEEDLIKKIETQRVSQRYNNQMGDIIAEMRKGVPFKDAIEKHGSWGLARLFGGDLLNTNVKQQVHLLPLTPQLKDTATKKGFPMFAKGGKINKSIDNAARKYANGGSTPWFVRQEASHVFREGMLHSSVPGRTDKLPINVPGGSYILPADIVSALGQGNSLSGNNILRKMFSSAPYGLAPMRGAGRINTGKLPRGAKISATKASSFHFARGGEAAAGKPTPIIAAGGEYVIPSEVVERIGGGDIDHGNKILDKFVLEIRKKHVKTLKKLPGPAKD